jgi:hypothetical protein
LLPLQPAVARAENKVKNSSYFNYIYIPFRWGSRTGEGID